MKTSRILLSLRGSRVPRGRPTRPFLNDGRPAARPIAVASAQVCATVHVNGLTRDVAGARPTKETHRRGDLLRGTEAAGEDGAGRMVGRGGPAAPARGVDEAGCEAIHRHPVLGEVVRQ